MKEFDVQIDDTKRSEIVFSYYLAPVILGEKPAAFFAFHLKDAAMVSRFAKLLKLRVEPFLCTAEKAYLFLYQETKLSQRMEEPKILQYLQEAGYPTDTLGHLLREMKKRFLRCMQQKEPFPHEIGVLLGFPLGDVKAFIAHQGQDALENGYWKVYENLEEAKQTFLRYDEARKTLLQFVTYHDLLEYGQGNH